MGVGTGVSDVADAAPRVTVDECFVGVADVDVAVDDVAGVDGVVEDAAECHAGPFLALAVADAAPVQFVGDGAGAKSLVDVENAG
jgi:hypothetical protein